MTHTITKLIILPLILVWILATFISGPHHVFLDHLNVIFELVIWWVGLGVLSSVGFGTGMHSGMLFLFPHIFFVVQGAEECRSTNFDSWHHVWFRAFETVCVTTDSSEEVTFWAIFRKVLIPCVLWGTGTALGEIPPYAISRAAQLAGQRDAEFEDITGTKSSFDIMNRMKTWMIHFLKTRGFFGVFLMAAWPNMAFDLCGICCGHFLMPFWTFFGATFLGKAIVKVNVQAMFFITIFTDAHMRRVEAFAAYITPESWQVEKKVNEFLVMCREKFHTAQKETKQQHEMGTAPATNEIAQFGSFVMIAFILYFAKSCIEQLAQQQAAEEDEQKVMAIRKQS